MSTARPLQILQRFPSHLEAARPDKQLWHVVEALSEHLDLLSTDLAGVRRAHRLKDADTIRDVLLIAGLHGLDRHLLDILAVRMAGMRALAKQLDDAVAAHDADTRDARAEAIFKLWGTAAPPPRLHLYAPPLEPGETDPDLDAAATALANAARASVSSRRFLEAARARVGTVSWIHAHGNGTVAALLVAAANALDLDIDEAKNAEVMKAIREEGSETLDLTRTDGFFHNVDRYRHATFARDRLQPPPRVDPAHPDAPPVPLPYDAELVGIEENPVVRHGADGPGRVGPKPHAALFKVSRRGFEHERLRIEIKGIADRTIGPHLVNRDDGVGIGFAGAVPDGKSLMIDEDGDFSIDGVDVSSLGYSWKGGCFADAAELSPKDFCFGGPGVAEGKRPAVFAEAIPVDGLRSDGVFPHPDAALEGPGIGVGHTRFAFFVQEAHLSCRKGGPNSHAYHLVTPRFAIAFADGSVFGTTDPAHRPDAADLTLSWLEHEAYTFKVLIPERFKALDTPELSLLDRVQTALERFRPMGVVAQAAYQDDTWIVGLGVLGMASGDPTLRILGGTVVSATPATET